MHRKNEPKSPLLPLFADKRKESRKDVHRGANGRNARNQTNEEKNQKMQTDKHVETHKAAQLRANPKTWSPHSRPLGSPCWRTTKPRGMRFSMMIMSSFVFESPVHLRISGTVGNLAKHVFKQNPLNFLAASALVRF